MNEKPTRLGRGLAALIGDMATVEGARVTAQRSPEPVRLARLHPAPFTDRLVRKFQLPVAGWRGPASTTPTGPETAAPAVAETGSA